MYETQEGGPGRLRRVRRAARSTRAAKLQFVTKLRKAVEQPAVGPALPAGHRARDRPDDGVEALIRWIEPDGTMVPPIEFIPLAEELGLIETIGDWVVRGARLPVARVAELGIDLEIGFNLSPRQFWQPDLAEQILARSATAAWIRRRSWSRSPSPPR